MRTGIWCLWVTRSGTFGCHRMPSILGSLVNLKDRVTFTWNLVLYEIHQIDAHGLFTLTPEHRSILMREESSWFVILYTIDVAASCLTDRECVIQLDGLFVRPDQQDVSLLDGSIVRVWIGLQYEPENQSEVLAEDTEVTFTAPEPESTHAALNMPSATTSCQSFAPISQVLHSCCAWLLLSLARLSPRKWRGARCRRIGGRRMKRCQRDLRLRRCPAGLCRRSFLASHNSKLILSLVLGSLLIQGFEAHPVQMSITRYGEAQNPGPMFHVGTTNPGGIKGKEMIYGQLPMGTWGIAETHLAQPGLRGVRSAFQRAGREYQRTFSLLPGAMVSLRNRSDTTGTWSGVMTVSDAILRPIQVNWPNNEYACGRVQMVQCWWGPFALTGATIYGWPSGPTHPHAVADTNALLETVVKELVISRTGPRYIVGDLNHPASQLPVLTILKSYGWQDVQELGFQRGSWTPIPTCKAPLPLTMSLSLRNWSRTTNRPVLCRGSRIMWSSVQNLTCLFFLKFTMGGHSRRRFHGIMWIGNPGNTKPLKLRPPTKWILMMLTNTYGRPMRTASMGTWTHLMAFSRTTAKGEVNVMRQLSEKLHYLCCAHHDQEKFLNLRNFLGAPHNVGSCSCVDSKVSYMVFVQGTCHQMRKSTVQNFGEQFIEPKDFKGAFASGGRQDQCNAREAHQPTSVYALCGSPLCDLQGLWIELPQDGVLASATTSWTPGCLLRENQDKLFSLMKTSTKAPLQHLVDEQTVHVLAISADQQQVHVSEPITCTPSTICDIDGVEVTVESMDGPVLNISHEFLFTNPSLLTARTHHATPNAILDQFAQFWKHRWWRSNPPSTSDWARMFAFAEQYLPRKPMDMDIFFGQLDRGEQALHRQICTWTWCYRSSRSSLATFRSHWSIGRVAQPLWERVQMAICAVAGLCVPTSQASRRHPSWRFPPGDFVLHGLQELVQLTSQGMPSNTWGSLTDAHQFGFLPGKEATEIWFTLQAYLEVCILQGEERCGWITDIQKAFENHTSWTHHLACDQARHPFTSCQFLAQLFGHHSQTFSVQRTCGVSFDE